MTKIRTLIEELNNNDVRYCHWKSNLSLAKSLEGRSDVDLLVHREDSTKFRTVLSQLCFKPAVDKHDGNFPSTEHYFAVDEDSGVLLHVHTYYRVITGESLTKSYRFPIEEMLLQKTRVQDFIRVPIKSAELIVFTLRIMLKHTTLVELLLLSRYWKEVKKEIGWLLEPGSMDETLSLIRCWLPSIDGDLFSKCVAALESQAPLFRRIILAHRLRSRLKVYSRQSVIRAWLIGIRKFTAMSLRRLTQSQRELVPQSGGAVIAFVGPEATGKSTLLNEIQGWLGEHFAVDQIHAGKPKSTLLSVIPNLFLPTMRFLFPASRSTHLEAQYLYQERSEKSRNTFPLIFGIRSVILAHDRRSLLSRAFSHAANGAIVLCDRYPSLQSGAPDSPQLSQILTSTDRKSFRHWLAGLEARLYREIPPPDFVIYLSAPLEITLSRNAIRSKTEPEHYVRRRHARSSNLDFGKTPIYKVNTDQPLNQTVLEVKRAIWEVL